MLRAEFGGGDASGGCGELVDSVEVNEGLAPLWDGPLAAWDARWLAEAGRRRVDEADSVGVARGACAFASRRRLAAMVGAVIEGRRRRQSAR